MGRLWLGMNFCESESDSWWVWGREYRLKLVLICIFICFLNLLTGSIFIVSGRSEYIWENLKKMDDFKSFVLGVYLGYRWTFVHHFSILRITILHTPLNSNNTLIPFVIFSDIWRSSDSVEEMRTQSLSFHHLAK